MRLAFQSLGVVYGDLGTSPLYVFYNTFPHGINDPEDVVGALSLIIYSLTLVPLLKYVFVVCRANDNGQGGTFALYSLLCRHANVKTIPNQHRTDKDLTTYSRSTFHEQSYAAKTKKWLERYASRKNALLILVLVGTCMVIGDGILTPAISVLSAAGGIKVSSPGMKNDYVILVAVVILVGLFSMQHYGTDKVGWLFAPIVLLWFLLIGGIGIFNIWKHDSTVLRAFSPVYIYRYFKRNGREGWISLGGIMLSITGTEALFADLAHFPVSAVQIAFTTVVFPCLLLAYCGQAAFLVKNHSDEILLQAFYRSIPGTAVVVVMLATTLLMTLIMILVWRCHWILVAIFTGLSLLVECTYFSAVLFKVDQGGWVPLVIAAAFLLIMYVWHYGTLKRYEFEMHSKVSMAWLLGLGPSLGLVRVPGIGLVYTELASGVPHIFSHFITNLPAIHQVVVLVCVKYLPVYTVPEEERFLVKRIGPKNFHMFRCVARYGYKDLHKKDDDFEKKLFENLFLFVRLDSMMEGCSDSDEYSIYGQQTERSLQTMSDNGDPEKKGGVWDLDKQLDQPMDEEAKTVRNVCGDQTYCSVGTVLQLAFQSLGVVYGDLGTSPLYVFKNIFPAGIDAPEDLLGALSVIIYSLTLIVLVKYVLIVCRANDNGQGGTFALYSLLCRHAKIKTVPNQDQSDEELTTFSRSTFGEKSFSECTKRWLEGHAVMRNILLILVLVGSCAVIGDGILTPAISVLSAVGGINAGRSQISNDVVVLVSVGILVLLFIVQQFGPEKVGWLFAPVVLLWFLVIGGIGIFNIWKYDTSVLKAFSPMYVYVYFKKGGITGWASLGGIVLCINGTETLFADVSHFPVLSIQIAFTVVVFPCLLLAYSGQAAYLMKNRDHVIDAFHYSIPGTAVVIVMLVTTFLMMLVMILVWRCHWTLVLIFSVLTFVVEGTYLSAVLPKVNQGGWVPLVLTLAFFVVMYGWHYGTEIRYDIEMHSKVSMAWLLGLGPSLGLVRVPGIGLVYSEIANGVPRIFSHFITNLPAIHSVVVFVCVKYLPVCTVPEEERFLVKRIGPENFHMFRCVVRYGYKDDHNRDDEFEKKLFDNLFTFVRLESLMEGSPGSDVSSILNQDTMWNNHSSSIPYSNADLSIASVDSIEPDDSPVHIGQSLAYSSVPPSKQLVELDGIEFLNRCRDAGVVHILGNTVVHARGGSNFFRKVAIDYLYAFLRKICRGNSVLFNVPHESLLSVGQIFYV
ncbi:hypothetical protein C1H46_037597 [Malus baccata]|uniref:Potassium transporter n=1 Tax=Malus baccata TaxID=106549 RepID=A0A540KRR2_MALBA|nr:hypothetical protein C1H46_037597 [Malus baccata]